MFLRILKYELSYWLKNPAVYAYAGFSFLFGLLSVAGNAGIFGEESTSATTYANTPFALYRVMDLYFKIALFMVPALMGQSVYRDFKCNGHPILYSYPIPKAAFLNAKFLGAFWVLSVIVLLFLAGCFTATILPGVNQNLIVSFNADTYVQLFLVYLLPNLLWFSVLVFSVVLLTRSLYIGYISIVMILIVRTLFLRLAGSAEINTMLLILELLGDSATSYYTYRWSNAEQQILDIPVGKFILLNRLFWLCMTFALSFFTLKSFSFVQNPAIFRFRNKWAEQASSSNIGSILKLNLPTVRYNYSWISHIKKAWLLSRKEALSILRTKAFIVLVFVGALLVYVLLAQMNAPYGVRLLPATWVMLAFPILFFSLLVQFITFLYAGILVSKSDTYRMGQLIDSTPVPNWTLALSKLMALIKIQVLLLTVIMVLGIGVQISQGYYHLEFTHYLFDLFAIHLIGFIIWALAALAVQTIFTNAWLGLFILVVCFFGVSQLEIIGIEKYIYRFNQSPFDGFYLYYSDLSGYGHGLLPYFIYKCYWLLFGIFFFMISLLFWRRGLKTSFRKRIQFAGQRLGRTLWIPVCLCILAIISFGFWIDTATIHQVRIPTMKEQESRYRLADAKYALLQNLTQPRVVAVQVQIDIFPDDLKYTSTGTYQLVNKSKDKIDTIIVHSSLDVITDFTLSKASSIIFKDPTINLTLLKLAKPLHPGDSLSLHFNIESIPNTLFYKNTVVEKDGTYINALVYPGFGYRTYDFSAGTKDTTAFQNHYRSFDSDYILFEATVSTAEDQTALAPGDLIHSWQADGRKYFQYKCPKPVTNDFAFVSGKYVLTKEKYHGIDLEIYHHKNHGRNVGHMMEGLKTTLDYCEKHFSPYPHKQIRIIEFSRTIGNYAQSFAQTIPYSEIGFITDIDEDAAVGWNLPFVGASHEFAHQWWGMQAIPADVVGAKMITESMAEFVSLKVLEEKYGRVKALEFLSKSHSKYLENSLAETETEPALAFNTGNEKAYIPYQKGMIAFNTLDHFLGEEKLNSALKNYLTSVKLKSAPYSTSLDMLSFIRQETSDSLQYLIDDVFETVTFFENTIYDAKIESKSGAAHQVSFLLEINKFRLQKGRKERLIPHDWVEIGFYKKRSNALPDTVQVIRIDQVKNALIFDPGFSPEKIVLDPNLLMIDKNRPFNKIEW